MEKIYQKFIQAKIMMVNLDSAVWRNSDTFEILMTKEKYHRLFCLRVNIIQLSITKIIDCQFKRLTNFP